MAILRAALYPRVSTEEQAKFGYSIEAQINLLTEHCKKNKIKIVDIYTEEGVSAGKPPQQRPQLLRLLEDVKAGKIDIVLFTKLDRWTRSTKYYYQVQEILDANKVVWQAILEDYETKTADGVFKVNLMLALSEQERSRTAERIKVVFENKWKNKEALFGNSNTPFGYLVKKDENGKSRLVKHPDTMDAVQAFWDIVIKYNNIGKAMRYVQATYGIYRDRQRWSDTIRNEIYKGTYKGVDDYCEPYVSAAEWENLQKRAPIKQTQKNRIYLFTGLLTCPKCHRRMSAAYAIAKLSDGTKKEYYQYRCQSSRDGGDCDGRSMAETKIEKWLLANIDNLIKNEIATVEIEKAKPKPKPKKNIPALREQLRRLEVVYMAGNKTDEEYIAETREIKEKIKQAEIERMIHEDDRDTSKLQHLLATDFRGIYETLDRDDRRRFWQSIIKQIHHENGRVTHVDFLYD